jgi:hypothetical protein
MKDIFVSTQDEYDQAMEAKSKELKSPFYDIERDRGREIIEEVDYLIFHYVCNDLDKKAMYDGLSHIDFDESQADKIMSYFQEHLPGDLFDIERGLNRLRVMPQGYEAGQFIDVPKLVIKDASEKIIVRSDVQVYGKSYVEAFDHAFITAKNNAYIIAHDGVSVAAYHKTRVDAYDHAQVRSFNNALVTASGESRVEAYHESIVRAIEKTEVTAYHSAYIRSTDKAFVSAYDKVVVGADGNSSVNAFDKSHIIASGASHVTAHDQSLIHASDKSKIEARNESLVLSRRNAIVTGIDNSLILSRDNAKLISSGNCFHINEKDNNAENLRKNILTVMRHPRFANDPIMAVGILLQAIPDENREGIHKKLISMGCANAAKTKNILNRWIKNQEENISHER